MKTHWNKSLFVKHIFGSLGIVFHKQPISSYGTNDKSNCITKIQNGEVVQNPILQILDFNLTSEDHHSVHLSDAASTIQILFGSTLSSLFTSSQVEIGSLVEINKFNCKSTKIQSMIWTYHWLALLVHILLPFYNIHFFHNKLSANYKFIVYVSQDSYSPWSTSKGFDINHYW